MNAPHVSIRLLGLVALTGLVPPSADAAPRADATSASPLPPELRALQTSLRRTRSVSARFTQTRRWSALKTPLITYGRLDYTRGGKLLWHTDPPAESDLTLEGRTAVMSYPALKTEQTIDFASEPGIGKVFETIRSVLQADLESLLPLFQLAVVRAEPLHVALKPRAAELTRVLSGIELDFDARLRLVQVRLDEGNGDTTEIAFSAHDVRTDPP